MQDIYAELEEILLAEVFSLTYGWAGVSLHKDSKKLLIYSEWII